jgi:hypothetical protein
MPTAPLTVNRKRDRKKRYVEIIPKEYLRAL